MRPLRALLVDDEPLAIRRLTLALADLLAAQMRELPCACVQVAEANITGNPTDGDLAAEAINRVLDALPSAEHGQNKIFPMRAPR